MKPRLPIYLCLLLLLVTTTGHAQSVTSSALSGRVYQTDNGAAIADTDVTLVHEPTGSVYSAQADEDGRYWFRGLRPGGPYTVSFQKSGFKPLRSGNVTLALQQTGTLDAGLESLSSEQRDMVFDLDAFEVVATDQNLVFIESNQGSSTRIDLETINTVPTVTRSLSDIARLDSRMAVYDRDSGQISAGGHNTRYNSLLIDGVPTNDSFGLSESGLPALKQPFSLESVAEVHIQHSPYSVENAGFTGAAISAITKSGSNDFHGSIFGYYRNESMVGDLTEVDSEDLIPFQDFTEYTAGASLSGPIIKNKLFFYVLYETVEESVVRDKATFDPDQPDIDRIVNATENFFEPFDIGELRDPREAVLSDDKLLLKLDWNISEKHRMSARFNRTTGTDPRFPDAPNGGFDSRWYEMEYTLDDITFEVFSRWTSNFSTELRVSLKEQGRNRINSSNLPLVAVQGVRADNLDRPGERISTTLRFGTEFIDELTVDTDIIHFKGTLFLKNHELKFGVQYESNSNSHLDIQYPYGSYRYEAVRFFEDGLNADDRGTPSDPGTQAGFSLETPAPGQTGKSEFKLSNLSAFVEDVWTVNDKLTVNMGLRIDYPLVDGTPPVARDSLDETPRTFEEVFGTSNQNTADGNYVIQPRVGFNYALKEDRTIQIRGGAGLFYGTAPHVWMATTYVDNGSTKLFYLTGSRSPIRPPFSLDPQDPIDYLIENTPSDEDPTAVSVNYLNPDFKMPTEWKSNLAIDIDLKSIGSILTLEGQWGWTEHDVHYINRNLKLKDRPPFKGFLPDGRALYDMNSVGADPNDRWRERGYREVIELTNTDKGKNEQYTIQLDRPMKNNFAWRIGYTYSRNKTVADGTSRNAYTNWASNVGFDPNSDILGLSSFNTPHRIVASFTYNLKWSSHHSTRFTMVYDGRVGRPYSYMGDLNVDMNGDGNDDNDLLYVPSGLDDPLVAWGNRNNNLDEAEAFMAWIDTVDGLKSFKGQVVPRNTGTSPWIHQVDLNITHTIKTWENQKLELILNIQNIGNLIDEGWGREKRPRGGYGKFVNVLTQGTHSPRNNVFVEGNEYGHFRYGYEDITERSLYFHPQGLSSRWAAQIGLRYSF
jgi:hypothetical protein